MTGLLLIAAGGLAREVLATVRASGQYEVLGFLDDDAAMAGTSLDGVPVLGPVSQAARHTGTLAVLCVGAGSGRSRLAGRLAALGFPAERYATIVDPTVRIPQGCRVGAGSILLPRVTLTAGVRLGDHVVAMPGVTLTHDDVVEDFATIAAGVSLGGGVRIGRGAYLGMNASVREHTRIGAGATVGMGAVVLNDVPDGETWAGVPARVLRDGAAGPGTSVAHHAITSTRRAG